MLIEHSYDSHGMAASPHVLVQDGTGDFVNPDSTGDPDFPSGVNVTPGNTVSIKLTSADSVGQWNLKVAGTDEETLVPALTDVDPSTGVVSNPSTVVTFTVPAGDAGRTYVFQSMVNNGGPAYTTRFGIYTLTSGGFRVAAVGERFEGDSIFGWTRTINKFIRSGGGGLAGYYADNTPETLLGGYSSIGVGSIPVGPSLPTDRWLCRLSLDTTASIDSVLDFRVSYTIDGGIITADPGATTERPVPVAVNVGVELSVVITGVTATTLVFYAEGRNAGTADPTAQVNRLLLTVEKA